MSDRSFNEFNLIVCRNVMIYFGRSLQNQVHELFLDSLSRFGILALGRKESIKGTHRRGQVRAARRAREDLPAQGPMTVELVMMGGSWGGAAAAGRVLSGMGASFTAPIVAVFHRQVGQRRGRAVALAGPLQPAAGV